MSQKGQCEIKAPSPRSVWSWEVYLGVWRKHTHDRTRGHPLTTGAMDSGQTRADLSDLVMPNRDKQERSCIFFVKCLFSIHIIWDKHSLVICDCCCLWSYSWRWVHLASRGQMFFFFFVKEGVHDCRDTTLNRSKNFPNVPIRRKLEVT